jgi:RHS repeat-associated protein
MFHGLEVVGLDYFGTRYFSGAQGRSTSPDAPFADQHPPDPQSWNLYSSFRNNSLRYVDPDGRACVLGIFGGDLRGLGDLRMSPIFSYDALGRVKTMEQLTGGQTYSSSYTYQRQDGLSTQVLPSGRTLTYA